ncbi:hypothetical protein PPL_11804 [Heterostelium album PN500]|uniref:Chitin-binding type-2 domain-containing protein n=1 Tax=Heterostelium pallidum (strain ATCC 26659 / Pp 5 / PN500) TaxID=670386 RepID=D3BUI4_HETP5|nr:hypothetical protein PPL_11804 [Heterostelium album PN500]EFA74772.1 hypothetical protein PPL_11804 [Heterostelium album PN500]|eukprot:XP_020426906.1 hypothetical protein PPL_11804 [Heterostelium album PN500]
MTAKLVLLFLFFTIVIFVNSGECDPRCDCDEVAKGCPGPRFCMKPNPDDCNNYIQCTDAGVFSEQPCPDGLQWNDDGLRCENPVNSTCHPLPLDLSPILVLALRFNNINIIGTCITNQSKLCSNSLRLTTTTSSSVRTYFTRVSAINQYNGNVVCIDSRAKKGGGGGGGGKNDKKENDDIVNWLITNRSEGFSYKSLEYAYNGSVELMKMLLRITTFGVTEAVMNLRNGRLELLKWLFENDNNSLKSTLQESMDSAANNGSVDVISWLNDNTTLRNSQATILKCMMTGKLEVVQWWLKKAAPEDDVPECIHGVIQTAARFGHKNTTPAEKQ